MLDHLTVESYGRAQIGHEWSYAQQYCKKET
jgi:hypothetical protein